MQIYKITVGVLSITAWVFIGFINPLITLCLFFILWGNNVFNK